MGYQMQRSVSLSSLSDQFVKDFSNANALTAQLTKDVSNGYRHLTKSSTVEMDISVRPQALSASEAATHGSGAFEKYKEYEAASVLLARVGEDLDSNVVDQIPVGALVTVLEKGSGASGRRLKVTTADGRVNGWISCVDEKGKSVLRRPGTGGGSQMRSNSLTSLFSNSSRTSLSSVTSTLSRASLTAQLTKDFSRGYQHLLGKPDPNLVLEPNPQIGNVLEAAIKLTLREGEGLHTPAIQRLDRGTALQIHGRGILDPNRVQVKLVATGVTGWVSIRDKKGNKPLLGRRMS